MTAYIVRIRNPLVRIPLWVHWWPFAVADCCIGAVLAGEWRRLFVRSFWALQADMLVVGIDGWGQQ